jgi:hypothetical protein
MTDERRIARDLEGSCAGLIVILSQHFLRGIMENDKRKLKKYRVPM